VVQYLINLPLGLMSESEKRDGDVLLRDYWRYLAQEVFLEGNPSRQQDPGG